MSRIERVLHKAEREGQIRRTSGGVSPEAGVPLDRPPTPVVASSPPRLDAALTGATAAPLPAPPLASPFTVAAPPREVAPPALVNPMAEAMREVRVGSVHPLLVAAHAPGSLAAEQYRALRTRIAHAENGRYYRAILVTSPSAGDGKTVTALNLALTMAQEFHKKVLVIDADLRHASVHRLLGLPQQPGLSEVLAGEVPLEEAMVSLPDFRLTVLPAGRLTSRPSELLGSAEMRRVLDMLRTQFDRVVLDTPPAAALADVGVLAPLVDGLVLVVRAGHTTRPAIERALREVDPARVLGLVLNDTGGAPPDGAYGSTQPPAPRARGWRRAGA